MISDETRIEIRRLYYAEHWRVGTIADALGVHHATVANAVGTDRFHRPRPRELPGALEPWQSFIRETLERHPRLRSTRVLVMLRDRGFTGSIWQVRRMVRDLRPVVAEPFVALRTFPGEEAQVDWAHFGKLQIGRAVRNLSAFVLVLSWSRGFWLEFFLDQQLESFLTGHVHAFHDLGGAARIIRHDNLRAAVLERHGANIRFHPRYLELCAHYHVVPRPCAPARGNQKGRVERFIRYVRESFFAGSTIHSVEDLNRRALRWRDEIALQRPWPDDRERTVLDAFTEERPRLLELPAHPFDCDRLTETRSRKSIYVRFDLNDYSIPPEAVGRPLTIAANQTTVRILDRGTEITSHQRSWDRGQTIEDPSHSAAVIAMKPRLTGHARSAALSQRVPTADSFLAASLDAGHSLARQTRRLEQLLADYGAKPLDDALQEALRAATPHTDAVSFILERRLRDERRRPLLPVQIKNQALANLRVVPHSLENYDALAKISQDDDEL